MDHYRSLCNLNYCCISLLWWLLHSVFVIGSRSVGFNRQNIMPKLRYIYARLDICARLAWTVMSKRTCSPKRRYSVTISTVR